VFAGLGWEHDSHLWKQDGRGTKLHESGTATGQLFVGTGGSD